MLEIAPFKGILYDREKIGDVAKVLTPPYDVISPQAQDKYYSDHEFNIVRIILGKGLPGDNEDDDRYIRAARYFRDWLEGGILRQDEEASIYAYIQEYFYKGEGKTRYGFIALMRLQDFDKDLVFPHEVTFLAPKEDRLKLMRKVKANTSPIFSVFMDKDTRIDGILRSYSEGKPVFDIEDTDGVRHRLWRISDVDIIGEIKDCMADKQVFIADGHHRYEAAIAFRDEMRKRFPEFSGQEDYNFVMVYLTPLDPEGLTILSVDRLIKEGPEIDIERLREFFKVDILNQKEQMLSLMEARGGGATLAGRREGAHDLPGAKPCRSTSFSQAERGGAEHRFGMYIGGGRYYLLVIKDERLVERIVGTDMSGRLRRLDATILDSLIFKHILNIEREDITYTKDRDLSIKSVDEGRCKMAFFLNPITVEEVRDIALARERMPQKSTYFYPKPLTGLVMNRLTC